MRKCFWIDFLLTCTVKAYILLMCLFGLNVDRWDTHLLSIKYIMTNVGCCLQTFEDFDLFNLIGVICGLAIYNLTIVELNFPVALYKKLLKRKPTLDDLKELMPDVGRSEQGTVVWGSYLTCLWMLVCLGVFLTLAEMASFIAAAFLLNRAKYVICVQKCLLNCWLIVHYRKML